MTDPQIECDLSSSLGDDEVEATAIRTQSRSADEG